MRGLCSCSPLGGPGHRLVRFRRPISINRRLVTAVENTTNFDQARWASAPHVGADACCSETEPGYVAGLLRLQRFQDGPRNIGDGSYGHR